MPMRVDTTGHQDKVSGKTTAAPADSTPKINQLITRENFDDF